ncbi:MAG: dephospho-CoA kinase [Pseudomonadales bacterium]|nr:dephospho-CoA kinase [Pseudomonadales bacterium]
MIIGLTGGIASGKSTAARVLAELGACVLDADKIGHAVYAPERQAFHQVVAAFGSDVVGTDGNIDRKVLGGKVFGKPEELKRLTAIVWPEIARMAAEQAQAALAENPARVVVLEAAVMLEAGWDRDMDEVWVVIVDPEVAVVRAMARDGVDEDAIRKRLAAQMSNAERVARADVVIENAGTPDALEARVRTEWQALIARSKP